MELGLGRVDTLEDSRVVHHGLHLEVLCVFEGGRHLTGEVVLALGVQLSIGELANALDRDHAPIVFERVEDTLFVALSLRIRYLLPIEVAFVLLGEVLDVFPDDIDSILLCRWFEFGHLPQVGDRELLILALFAANREHASQHVRLLQL